MVGQLIPLGELTARDLDGWQQLASRAIEPNPFFEPGFVLPAARALNPSDLGLYVVRRGGATIAALPVRRTRGWRRMPLRGTISWRHPYSFLGTPLVDGNEPVAAVEALIDSVLGDRASSFLAIELLGAGGAVASALEAAARERGVKPIELLRFERAALNRRADGGYLDVSPKHRREWRRQRRRLAERLGEELETVDRAGSETAVEEFLRLEASGWKGAAGTAFAKIGHDTLFRDLCREFAAQGRLQLLSLEAAGKPVAMKCNLAAGTGLFCFKIAYDATLSGYSPGMQLELDNIQRFHESKAVHWMDSCASRANAMIGRLWPDRRPIAALLLPAPGPRGAVVRSGALAAARVRAARS